MIKNFKVNVQTSQFKEKLALNITVKKNLEKNMAGISKHYQRSDWLQ